MSEANQSAQPEVKFTPIEILSFGGELREGGKMINAEAEQNAARLREFVERGKRGKELFRAQIEQAKRKAFAPKEREMGKAQFGLGEAEIDAETGKAKIGEEATGEAKQLNKESSLLIDNYSNLQEYLDIITSEDPKKKFQDLKNTGRIEEEKTYQDFQGEVLDFVANDPLFRSMIPELYGRGVTEKTRRAQIEDYLARDPVFKTRLAERLAEIYQEAADLPVLPVERSIEELNEKLNEGEVDYEGAAEDILARLKAAGVEKLDGEAINQDKLKQLISEGRNTDEVLRGLIKEVLAVDDVTLQQVITFQQTSAQLDRVRSQLRERIETLRGQLIKGKYGAEEQNKVIKSDETVKQLGGTEDRLKETVSELEERRSTDKAFDKTVFDFENIIQPLLSAGVSERTPEGSFWQSLKKAKNIQLEAEKTKKQIDVKKKEKSPEMAQKRKQRAMVERRLLSQLESVLGESVGDVMEERYDKMEQTRRQMQAEKNKEVQERKDAKTRTAEVKVERAMDERWIRLSEDGRKKISFSNIGEDVEYLIYEGENGLKRVMMAIVFENKPISVLEADPETGEMKEVGKTWENIDFYKHQLTGENKELFEAVYEKYGGQFRDKLFTDLFVARQIGERGRVRKWFDRGKYRFEGLVSDVKFREAEWEALEENFSKEIDKTIQSSKEGQTALKRLKEKGITPSFKLKWLIYILIALGVVGGGALKKLEAF